MANNSADDLRQDGFWATAFEHDVPFLEEYRTTFRRGLIDGNVGLLNLHREAIYYLSDGALWPVISRLIEVASQHVESSFIESLSHFLEVPIQQSRLLGVIAASSKLERLRVSEFLIQLISRLQAACDEHLSPGFEWLHSVLAAPD